MESTTWSFVIPLYPAQFTEVGKSVLKFVHSHLNKFIPELNGLLVEFDKSTLHIHTSEQTNWAQLYPQFYGIFLIRPELNYLRIRAKINVRVFIPKVGQELDAVVLTVKPHVVLCNTEVAHVTVSLPRQGNSGLPADENTQDIKYNQLSQLKPSDRVKVKLTQVILNPTLFIIRGELVDVIKDCVKAADSILKRFETDSCSADSDSENEDAEPVKCESPIPKTKSNSITIQSNIKCEYQSTISQRVIKPEDNSTLLTPEVECITVRKSGKSKSSNQPDSSVLSRGSFVDLIQSSSEKPKKRKHSAQTEDTFIKTESF